MKPGAVVRFAVALSAALGWCPVGSAAEASPVTTAFTYQGTLLDGGAVPTGSYDFLVGLYDSPGAPVPVTTALTLEDVPVAEGLFQLTLDFGYQFFGERRWIQVAVRDGGSLGAFEPLLPRQELTATPNAQFATTSLWFNLLGKPAGFDDDVDDDLLNALPCAIGEIPLLAESGWGCATYLGGGGGWQLTGNSGTIAGTHFLGTTDTQPLELRVNNQPALRVVSVNAGLGDHFNIVAGLATVASGLNGITVAGGGLPASPNLVFSNVSTIAGGFANEVGTSGEPSLSAGATVSGGNYNWARAAHSTVGGGSLNRAQGELSVIAGGVANRAYGTRATVAGGEQNEAHGARATIGGGGNSSWARGNAVWNDFGTVAGGGSNEAGAEGSAADDPARAYATVGGGRRNTAARQASTIGGGELNRALGAYGAIGGGGPNPALGYLFGNVVTDDYGTIGGGTANRAGSAATPEGDPEEVYATVGGGLLNVALRYGTVAGGGDNQATGTSATIGGGSSNRAGGQLSTVGGGTFNSANGDAATVAGGDLNAVLAALGTIGGGGPGPTQPGQGNVVLDTHGTVGGGASNRAGDDDGDPDAQAFATVGGGIDNVAMGLGATVGGGSANFAAGGSSVVAGGASNEASAIAAAVGGGLSNFARGNQSTIAGGGSNEATGVGAAIGGGEQNLASGDDSAIPGGTENIAGCLNCLAAGAWAHAIHQGSFVWAEHTATTHVPSPAEYTFSVQAAGGIWLGTDRSPSIPAGRFLNTSTGAYLSSTGDWTNASDRKRKEGLEPVDGGRVLDAVLGLPLTTWSYIGDPTGARHLGPMAQDFRAAFGLGRDEVSISTVDAAGVALAAIQELARRTDDLARALTTIEALERRLAALEAREARP